MNKIPSALSLGLRRGGLEIRQFARQRESVVFTLLFPVILLVIFGSVFKDTIAPGVTFSQYFLAGMIASGLVNTGFQALAITIPLERDFGALKRLRGNSVTVRPMIWWNSSSRIEFDANDFTTTPIYRAQWVYVALSKPSGSSSPSYYVNGVLVGTGSVYSTPAVTPTWLNRGASNTWKGNCSIIQAYNRALTSTEITQNFNATKSRYGL